MQIVIRNYTEFQNQNKDGHTCQGARATFILIILSNKPSTINMSSFELIGIVPMFVPCFENIVVFLNKS